MKKQMNPTKYYYVAMFRGYTEEDVEGTVTKTYSEKKAIKIAKTFMKKYTSNSKYAIAQVDVTMFWRLYKRTWRKKGANNSKVTPKIQQVFILPEDAENFKKMGVALA